MDLSGQWRAAPADETLRRVFHQRDFVDDAWESLRVPGHWQDAPAFADHEGSLLYRHRFEAEPNSSPAARSWLELDGLFYQGDVYLDEEYLGDTEGYFVKHAFDITESLRAATEHDLAIEVNCHPGGAQRKRRALLGVFEGGNDVVGTGNPGGIWAPVRIRDTGPIRIDSVRAICTLANPTEAKINIRATMLAASACAARLSTDIAGVSEVTEHPLAEGTNEIEWNVTVSRPALWWPRRLGQQPLHDLRVQVLAPDGSVSDTNAQRIGFRALRVSKNKLLINDEPLFVKGVNLAPAPEHMRGGDDSGGGNETALSDLELAAGLELDLVRPYAHVAPPTFYDKADEMGMLVWQDLPLLGSAANGIRGEAVRQACAMVNQLGSHPSIVVWNAHVGPTTPTMKAEAPTTRHRLSKLAGHQLPTWSKSVLDRSIKRVFDRDDGSRPSSAFTGVLPHLPRLDSSPSHLWFGWRRGSERDLAEYAAKLPNQVRWVAEFGAQSLADDDYTRHVVDWPLDDIERLAAEAGYEELSFARYSPPHGHPSFEAWIDATQRYQAGLLRRQIESLRRLKYNPTSGFCFHFLRDAQPRVSASIVGWDRRPKLAYDAVAEACRKVIVVADRMPARVRAGDPVALDVHVVSDARGDASDAVVDAVIRWRGGEHRWRFGGTIEADAATRIGTLSWVVPDAPGIASLSLTLSGPVEATNRYTTTIST